MTNYCRRRGLQVEEGEALLADAPARWTAAWAAGGKAVGGVWALHEGRLAKVYYADRHGGCLQIVYLDTGAKLDMATGSPGTRRN